MSRDRCIYSLIYTITVDLRALQVPPSKRGIALASGRGVAAAAARDRDRATALARSACCRKTDNRQRSNVVEQAQKVRHTLIIRILYSIKLEDDGVFATAARKDNTVLWTQSR